MAKKFAESAPEAAPVAAAGNAAAEPLEDALVSVVAGQWLVMNDEHWSLCSENDLNMRLTRRTSKIGVALADFSYDPLTGCEPPDCETFTLRQFWRDASRPTLDFTERSVRLMLGEVEKYQAGDRRKRLEKVLLAPEGGALRRFRELYRNYEADEERLKEREYQGI